ncbi:hypothetical protein FRC01_011387, partial [Tulasnella sp. 417]
MAQGDKRTNLSLLEGGQILNGQIRFAFVRLRERDGREFLFWRHLGCVTDAQKKRIPKTLSSPAEIQGYTNLRPDDQRMVDELFGWNEQASLHTPVGGDSFTNDIQDVNEVPSGLGLHDDDQELIVQPDGQTTFDTSLNPKSTNESGRQGRPEGEDSKATTRKGQRKSDSNRSKSLEPNLEGLLEPDHLPLMWLELEEKQGRVRLAEAELKAAEARAK